MRNWTQKGLIGILTLILAATAEAQYVPTHVSGCGTARIDGIWEATEWANAGQKSFALNLPGGGTSPATLYVMNDNLNLYFAVRFARTAPDWFNELWVFLDKDGIDNIYGGVTTGDDYFFVRWQAGAGYQLYDSSVICSSPSACGAPYQDASVGGTLDVTGAFHNDGQWSVLELSHELRSGDSLDVDLAAGSSIEFHTQTNVCQASPWACGNTGMPSNDVDYDVFHVGACYPSRLSGCGRATIDGEIGNEWSGAARHRLSVRTPGGGTAPGTLLVMNDHTDLYMGLQFDRSSADAGNGLAVEIDNDKSKSLSDWDDVVVYTDGVGFADDFRSTQPPCPSGAICGFRDIDYGGNNDGTGAFHNDGVTSSYEITHPLASGEMYDLSLSLGATIGFFLDLRMIAPGGAWPADFGDTRYPDRGYIGLTARECRVRGE